MASAITGTGLFSSCERWDRAWPSGVPTGATASAQYDSIGDNTLVFFKWLAIEDFGHSSRTMAYAHRVSGYVNALEIESWRKLAAEAFAVEKVKKAERVVGYIPTPRSDKPSIVPCTGCGLDTFSDPNNIYDKSNALCYYCTELKTVRTENAKTVGKYYARLPWRDRRRFRREMGWTRSNRPRPASTGFG